MNIPEKSIRFADREQDILFLLGVVTKAGLQPRTLYVKRRLLNGDAVRAWAASQGIAFALPANDMHVTVAFSKEPVDWSALEPQRDAIVVQGDARQVRQFPARTTPNGALVLRFESPELAARWRELRDAGASWDFPEYQPHVTITYSVPEADVSAIEPYRGPLIFGSEEFTEVDEGWAGEVEEEPLIKAFDPNQLRDDQGQWADTGVVDDKDVITGGYDAVVGESLPQLNRGDYAVTVRDGHRGKEKVLLMRGEISADSAMRRAGAYSGFSDPYINTKPVLIKRSIPRRRPGRRMLVE